MGSTEETNHFLERFLVDFMALTGSSLTITNFDFDYNKKFNYNEYSPILNGCSEPVVCKQSLLEKALNVLSNNAFDDTDAVS